MFGGSSNTWGAPQQPTNIFGASANQQQPAGGFGSTTTNTFGAQQQQNVFGQPQQQQTAGGLFGQSANTGGAFGSNAFGAARPNAFGAPAQTNTPAFGATNTGGGGLFGGATTSNALVPTNNAFGGGSFGSAATTANKNPGPAENPPPPPGDGTASKQLEKDTDAKSATNGMMVWKECDVDPSSATKEMFVSITAFPAFQGASFEQLRLLDYQQNRRQPTFAPDQPASTGLFGAPAAQTNMFGAPAAATSTFGQPAQQTSLFGAPKPATSGFGAPATGGGLFGSTNTTNAFGQPAQQQPATNAFSFGGASSNNVSAPKPAFSFGGASSTTTPAFGQPAQNAAPAFGSTFGQPPQQATTAGFGGFGQTQQPAQQPATSLFGQAPQQQPQQQTGGLFGQPAKPAGTGLFGQPAAPATGGGLFGQPAQQNTGGGLFGSTSAQPSTGGLFGNTQQPQQQTSLFGNTNAGAQPAAPAFGGGLFGNNAAKPATPTGGGLFGQPAQQPAATGGGLFGATNPNTGGGLFGNTNNAQNNSTALGGGGLFGAPKPAATGGLFGNTSTNTGATGGGLFGGLGQSQPQPQQPQQQGLSGGLFGGGGGSSSLFGGSHTLNNSQQQQQQPQQSLQASIDQNPYGSNALFSDQNAATLPAIEPLPQKKTPLPMFASTRTRTPQSSKNLSRLRGFAASPAPSPGSPSNVLSMSSNGRASPAAKEDATAAAGLSPHAFVSRNSVKKLVISRPVGGSDVLGFSRGLSSPGVLKNATAPASAERPKVQFDNRTDAEPFYNEDTSFNNGTPAPARRTGLSSSGNIPPPQQPNFSSSSKPVLASSSGPASNSPATKLTSTALSIEGFEGPDGLERGQYWTSPEISVLRNWSLPQLKAVDNFVVGCKGLGQVKFLAPVDLTPEGSGVRELSQIPGTIVVFEEKRCVVYPEDGVQVSRGEGLNVPAEVTLYRCYPIDKATRQPLVEDVPRNQDDVKHPKIRKHIANLKAVKNTKNTRYNTKTGMWTFNVEHFSGYGVPDDSDEDDGVDVDVDGAPPKFSQHDEEDEMAVPKAFIFDSEDTGDDEMEDVVVLKPSKLVRSAAPVAPQQFSSDETGEEDEEEDEDDRASGDLHMSDMDSNYGSRQQSKIPNSPARPWASTIGVEPRKIQVMQQSLFGRGNEDLSMTPKAAVVAVPSTRFLGSKKHELSTSAASGQFFGEEGEGLVSHSFALSRPSFDTTVEQPHSRPTRKYAKISAQDSLISEGRERIIADSGLSMGRSFRASWGPNGTLIHMGTLCGPKDSNAAASGASVKIDKVKLLSQDSAVEAKQLSKLLEYQLKNTTIQPISSSTGTIPFATPSSSLRFSSFAALFPADDTTTEALLFRLGHALFDEIPLNLPPGSAPEFIHKMNGIRRKLALGKWLLEAVSPSVDHDLLTPSASSAGPSRVFTFLSGNQVELAVQTALDAGDLRLASLLPRIGGSAKFKGEIIAQLEKWKEYHIDAQIDNQYRRLYALLGGIVDVLPGDRSSRDSIDKSDDVIVHDGLDWKRVFGLHLWFGTPFSASISDALDSYSSSLESLRGSQRPVDPRPAYMERPSASSLSTTWSIPKGEDTPRDILYLLIQLYADTALPLSIVLKPMNFTPSPLDHRLSWSIWILLSKVLRARDFGEGEGCERGDELCKSFAAGLEWSGDWVWAVFVLLHVQNDNQREKSIRELLNRQISAVTPKIEEHLISELLIPRAWIASSRALLSCSEGDLYSCYLHHIDAREYTLASKIAIGSLCVEAVLRDDWALVRHLLQPLEGKNVDGWEGSGRVFLNLIQTIQRLPSLLASHLGGASTSISDAAEVDEIKVLSAGIPGLISVLPSLFEGSQSQGAIVCRAEVGGRLLELAGELGVAGFLDTTPVVPKEAGLLLESEQLTLLQSAALDRFGALIEGLS